MKPPLYSIWFYVPDSHLEAVKTAMFIAGAGHVGHYDCCAWQTQGEGQYRALAGSKPFIGNLNEIETVNEYRVEMVCPVDKIQLVVSALKQTHPYDEVAFGVVKLETW